jgi:uncharacterized membrane protein
LIAVHVRDLLVGADSDRRSAHHGAFGNDRFGVLAERFARFFGTPKFIIGQTVLVALWIAVNAAAFSFQWDPYPFILLNLAFSTQAAYAAPLILLAQTRQAERDKLRDAAVQEHHDADIQRERDFEARQLEVLKRERELAEQHLTLLAQNTRLTEEIARLTAELHATICVDPKHRPVQTG